MVYEETEIMLFQLNKMRVSYGAFEEPGFKRRERQGMYFWFCGIERKQKEGRMNFEVNRRSHPANGPR